MCIYPAWTGIWNVFPLMVVDVDVGVGERDFPFVIAGVFRACLVILCFIFLVNVSFHFRSS